MKKFLFLAVVIALSAKFVSAQTTTYPIWINGVQVTDTNASAITGAGISGTIQYIDSTKTLKFVRATVSSLNTAELLKIYTKVKIEFEDSNYIQGHPCSNLAYFGDSVEFVSNPSAVLTFRHTGCFSMQSVIWANHIDFSAQGTINICYGQPGGIIRTDKPLLRTTIQNNELRFNQGNVMLFASSNPIKGYRRVVMDNRYFTYPRNTYYDTVTKALVNPLYTFDSVLVSSEYTPPYHRPVYPIKVAGTQVTVLNADSITGPGVSGHVSYDSVSNTLTLNNATITSTEHYGIEADSSITINCIGYNIVNCCNNDAISHSKIPLLLKGADFTIQGVSGNDTLAISTYRLPTISTSDNLHISNLNLLSNFGDGISKHDTNNTGDLTITNCIAKIIGGTNCGPICGYNNLNLRQCEIVRPVAHRYSAANQRIEDSTGNPMRYMDTLVIEKTHVGTLSAGKEKTELTPNPVSTNLHVVSESVIDQLQVFDTYGRLLKTIVPNTKQAIVNVRELRNGIYTIIIKSQNGTTARQFVVKH